MKFTVDRRGPGGSYWPQRAAGSVWPHDPGSTLWSGHRPGQSKVIPIRESLWALQASSLHRLRNGINVFWIF